MKDTKLSQTEFRKLIANKMHEVVSRKGILYSILSVTDIISVERQSTKKIFSIDMDELYEAYNNEDLSQLDTLTNQILEEKYGLFMVQSIAWAILKKVYELTEK